MNVTVKGRGVEVTPAMRDYAQKKLNKLTEFDPELRNAEVTCKCENNFHKIEVMLTGDGVRLRAEERRPDMYEAIDSVLGKLEQQAKKHHKRLIERTRHHSAKELPTAFVDAGSPDVSDYSHSAATTTPETDTAETSTIFNGGVRITRTKIFAMKPMSPLDAAVEMEMMGHQFFAFRNAGGDVNVVYRRDDGTYGLIEPGE